MEVKCDDITRRIKGYRYNRFEMQYEEDKKRNDFRYQQIMQQRNLSENFHKD